MERKKNNDVFETCELTDDILAEQEPDGVDREAIITMSMPKVKHMSKLTQGKKINKSESANANRDDSDKLVAMSRPYIWGLELHVEGTPDK